MSLVLIIRNLKENIIVLEIVSRNKKKQHFYQQLTEVIQILVLFI